MTLDDLNKIINDALVDVVHGQLVNATTLEGDDQRKRLRADFRMIISLDAAAKKVAAELFPPTGGATHD